MATSPLLAKHSHGKGIDEVIAVASEVIEYVKSHGMEVRFSCEDTFRSDKSDLLKIYAVRRFVSLHLILILRCSPQAVMHSGGRQAGRSPCRTGRHRWCGHAN